MKKIKVLTSFYYNDYPYQAGQIYNLDDDIANKLELEKRVKIISNLTNKVIENVINESGNVVWDKKNVEFNDGYYYHYKTLEMRQYSGRQCSELKVKAGEKYLISGMSTQDANLVIVTNKEREMLFVYPNNSAPSIMHHGVLVEIEQDGYLLINQYYEPTTVKEIVGYKSITYNETNRCKWCAFGDSLTATIRGEKNYVDFVSENLNIIGINCGAGGTGYLRSSNSGGAFYNRVNSIPDDTNILTVFGSFNDLFVDEFSVGEVTDTDTSTLCGAVNTFLNSCYAKNIEMKIGIISPTPWSIFHRGLPETNANLTKVIDYVNALEEIAKIHSIPFLNLFDASNLRPWDTEFNNMYFVNHDGTHPNTLGHEKFIAKKIEQFIKTLY